MKLDEKYVVWLADPVGRTFSAGTFTPPKGVEDFEVNDGTSLSDRWKKPGTFELVDGDSKKPEVADCLHNQDGLRIVSKRVKDVLAAHVKDGVEFLPVTLTLKKKPAKLEYFVVNCFDRVPCLDAKKSGLKGEGHSARVKRLVLSKDPGRAVLQVEGYGSGYLVSLELAEVLSKHAFSGFRYMTLAQYPEGGRTETPLDARVDELYDRHFSANKVLALDGSAPKPPERASETQVKSWLAAAPATGKFKRGTWTSAFHAGEDDTWLEAFEDAPDDWPDFDPKRYRAFGFDGQGNHWLIDLEKKGAIVFLSHEQGYAERHMEVVSRDMQAFSALVKPA